MKLQRIDKGTFAITLGYTENTKIDLLWKNGEIFLAVTGILLSHENAMYELPLKDIKSVEVIESTNPLLRISGDTFTVTISSKNINNLKSLKFLILPYIS